MRKKAVAEFLVFYIDRPSQQASSEEETCRITISAETKRQFQPDKEKNRDQRKGESAEQPFSPRRGCGRPCFWRRLGFSAMAMLTSVAPLHGVTVTGANDSKIKYCPIPQALETPTEARAVPAPYVFSLLSTRRRSADFQSVVSGRRFASSAQPRFLSLSSSKRRRGPG